jgi:flagellar M-ring protein FliF
MEQLRSLGAMRLIAIFGLSAGLAAALLFFSFNMGGGSQALLYSGLDPSDSAQVSEALDSAGITYEFRNGGSAIYVARNQVDEARVRVASGGALNSGSVGYEIFDESDALGATSFVQNMNAKRALEGELARTIQSLDNISTARVHLVLPERRLFERDAAEPSASIVISARGDLTREHAAIIRNIVASAVNGLSARDITIADTTGRLLASPEEGDALGPVALESRRAEMEEQYRRRILDLVEGVVGTGAARVQVSVELNRNSITQSEERYDPDGSVLRSRQRTSEESTETDGASNAVSASENLPDEGGASGDGPQSARQSENTTDNQEFALSRTTTTRVTEAGEIERMSVAVAVDGTVEIAEDGTRSYTPRSEEEMAQITALVRSAMGFTQIEDGRQDSLEVTNIRFARADPELGTPAASGFSLNKDDIMRAAEIGVMFITALLVIFLVARPLAKGAANAAPALAIAGGGGGGGASAAAVEGPDGQAAIADQRAQPMPQATQAGGGSNAASMPAETDDGIDIAKIDGQVKASSIKKISGVVSSHPDESLSIIRSWMNEG